MVKTGPVAAAPVAAVEAVGPAGTPPYTPAV